MKLNVSEKGIQLDFKELSLKDGWLTVEEMRKLRQELIWIEFDWYKLMREKSKIKPNG